MAAVRSVCKGSEVKAAMATVDTGAGTSIRLEVVRTGLDNKTLVLTMAGLNIGDLLRQHLDGLLYKAGRDHGPRLLLAENFSRKDDENQVYSIVITIF
jgi:hypothetical protein